MRHNNSTPDLPVRYITLPKAVRVPRPSMHTVAIFFSLENAIRALSAGHRLSDHILVLAHVGCVLTAVAVGLLVTRYAKGDRTGRGIASALGIASLGYTSVTSSAMSVPQHVQLWAAGAVVLCTLLVQVGYSVAGWCSHRHTESRR